MIIDNMFQVSFTENEIIEAMVLQIECEANDLVASNPDNRRLRQLAGYIRDNKELCGIEHDDGSFHLMIDGVPIREMF